MSIMLGNLSVKQITERLGIEITEDERKALEDSRQENAQNIAPDKWHGFDIPFMIVCGSRDAAVKVMEILKPYSNKMRCPIQIGFN